MTPMIKKSKGQIIILFITGMILTACWGGENISVEEADLQHLVTPANLMVQSKEVYEMVQEIGNSGPGIAFDDPSQLEDEERQEVEAFLDSCQGECRKLRKGH